MMNKHYWVYMLQCSNGSFYTGYTDNLEKRFQEHLSGKGSKYTRSFKPVAIVQNWLIEGDKSMALRIERYIKSCSKSQKSYLIQHPEAISLQFNMQPLAVSSQGI